MAPAGHLGSRGHRRLLDTAPAPAGGDGADRVSTSSQDAISMRITVGVLVTVVFCTLLYCIYCWRWRKRNGAQMISLLDVVTLDFRCIAELR
ncbi:unnamed protein product [Urochloa humidicola]